MPEWAVSKSGQKGRQGHPWGKDLKIDELWRIHWRLEAPFTALDTLWPDCKRGHLSSAGEQWWGQRCVCVRARTRVHFTDTNHT